MATRTFLQLPWLHMHDSDIPYAGPRQCADHVTEPCKHMSCRNTKPRDTHKKPIGLDRRAQAAVAAITL